MIPSASASPNDVEVGVVAHCAMGLEPQLVRELQELGLQARKQEPGQVRTKATRAQLQRIVPEVRCARALWVSLGRVQVEQLAKHLDAFDFDYWLQLAESPQLRVIGPAHPAQMATETLDRWHDIDARATLHLHGSRRKGRIKGRRASRGNKLDSTTAAANGVQELIPYLDLFGDLDQRRYLEQPLGVSPSAMAAFLRSCAPHTHESGTILCSGPHGLLLALEARWRDLGAVALPRALPPASSPEAGERNASEFADTAPETNSGSRGRVYWDGSPPVPAELLELAGELRLTPPESLAEATCITTLDHSNSIDGAARVGENMRRYRHLDHVVISPSDIARRIPRSAESVRTASTPHGIWHCALFRRGSSEPQPHADTQTLDPRTQAFAQQISENAHARRRWPKRHGLECYRLFDREHDAVPWVVDRYADCLHVTSYPPKKPASGTAPRPPAAEPGSAVAGGKPPTFCEQHREQLLQILSECLKLDPARIFFKEKAARKKHEQHTQQSREGFSIVVRENDLKFRVNLTDYVDTGIFLDHRLTREKVRRESRGKRVLNLFGYTGTFTVYAAAGGATSTVTVDTSRTYLDWARDNLALNGYDETQHRRVREDASQFLAEHPPGDHYDLVIVDPPTFSNRWGNKQVWDVERDHATLMRLLLPLLSEDGVVLFSTNKRGFGLDRTLRREFVMVELSPKSIPPEIKDRRCHRAYQLTARRTPIEVEEQPKPLPSARRKHSTRARSRHKKSNGDS